MQFPTGNLHKRFYRKMSSKREQILAYIATQMAAVAGISGNAFRSRPEAVRKEEIPCILIEPVSDRADYNTMDFINWQLQVKITIVQRGTATTIVDSDADPIYVAAYKKMMEDRTLAGRCQDIYPSGVEYNFLEGDMPTLIQSCNFTIIYRTLATDPEA